MIAMALIAIIPFFSACSGVQPASIQLPAPTPTATPVPTSTPQGNYNPGTPSPTPSPSATPTPGPSPGIPEYFSVNAYYPSPIYAPTHLFSSNGVAATDWSQSCKTDVSTTATGTVNDIICYTEVADADLYAQTFNFSYTAPIDGCAYVLETPYYFVDYPTGTGPATISYTVEVNGTIDTLAPGAGWTIVNSAPSCSFDYTSNFPNGPNCCAGKYTATIDTKTLNAAGATVDTFTTKTASWGGKVGNCAEGAVVQGTTFARSLTTNLPVSLLITTYGGLTGGYSVPANITKPWATAVPIANYVANPAAPPPPLNGQGHLYYQWDCLDPAFALQGRIRLMVRKWKMQSQLALGINGNPDLTGVSDGQPDPYIDYDNWAQIEGDAVNFPTGYPETTP